MQNRLMTRLSVLALCGFVCAAPWSVVWAKVPVARARQANQAERIHQGVKSGELTRHEAHKLAKGQRHIQQTIHQARKDDGHIDGQERAQIARMQHRQSERIYQQKHDAQDRH